jgi:hypothetical protein
MAETTADVRRDIELTRERMSTTLQELEQRLNLMKVVRDHPWPALAVAFGAGVMLSGTSADVRAANATSEATHTLSRRAGGRLGPALDGLVADLIAGVRGAFEDRMDSLIGEVRQSILGNSRSGGDQSRAAADLGASHDRQYNVSEVDGMHPGAGNAPRAD